MSERLVSALRGIASWLQSASQVVPISQLSVVTWAFFTIFGSFDSKSAFNITEQSVNPLSKASFQ